MQRHREPLIHSMLPIALLFFTLVPTHVWGAESSTGPGRTGMTWDVNAELGRRWSVGANASNHSTVARVRGGILWVREPLYFSAGPFVDVISSTSPMLGLQGEVMHLWSGLWAQSGPTLDFKGSFGAMAALGWSLFGLETQKRFTGHDDGFLFMAKIRIPIGILAFGVLEPE